MALDPMGGTEVANILRSLLFVGVFLQYGDLDTGDLSVPVSDMHRKDLTICGDQQFEIIEDLAGLPSAASRRDWVEPVCSMTCSPLFSRLSNPSCRRSIRRPHWPSHFNSTSALNRSSSSRARSTSRQENTRCACDCQLEHIGEDVSEDLDFTAAPLTVE